MRRIRMSTVRQRFKMTKDELMTKCLTNRICDYVSGNNISSETCARSQIYSARSDFTCSPLSLFMRINFLAPQKNDILSCGTREMILLWWHGGCESLCFVFLTAFGKSPSQKERGSEWDICYFCVTEIARSCQQHSYFINFKLVSINS